MKRIFSILSIVVAVSIPLMVAHAKPKISKDWEWDINIDNEGSEYAYARTLNTEGRILGQICFISDGSCLYFVNLGVTCETNSITPSLINSDKATTSVSLVCNSKHPNYNNVFYVSKTQFNDVHKIVLSADNIGFAVAMKSGSFKVVRFSLSGSTHAIEMMRIWAEKLIRRKSELESQRDRPSEEYL